MRKITLFGLMTFCAIITSFAQTPKDVLIFRLKTAIASFSASSFLPPLSSYARKAL